MSVSKQGMFATVAAVVAFPVALAVSLMLLARSTLAAEATVTATLSATRLAKHVFVLASDEFEGRGPATHGIAKAADYLEHELETMGLQGAFAGSFRQSFELTVGSTLGPNNVLAQGSKRFHVKQDFLPWAFSRSADVQGRVVFAGFGIRSKEARYDDYDGLEVEGKVVVVLSGSFDDKRFTHQAAIRTKVLLAREAKAKAILIVRDQLGDSNHSPGQESDAGIVALSVTRAAATSLLGFDPVLLKERIERTHKPQGRISTRAPCRISADVVRDRRVVANVVAMLLPKSATSTETVVLGAHYDHLGFGGPSSLSSGAAPEIHNGADDNASGTAAVLEIARALASKSDRLRRRVAFALFAGEEDGLLGSAYFVKHPPVDLGSIAAMVNLDMVGRLRDRKLNVMGTGTAREFKELAQRLVEGRGLHGTYGGDGYGPSDHTSFYAAGIPVLFLFTGAHANYHRSSDDADTLNYMGLAEVGAVATDLTRALATAIARPTYVHTAAPKIVGGSGYGPYFGSIPDFGDDRDGVLLSGVRQGSPADKAGVKKGDIIVRFNGMAVQNLQDLTVALRASAPGDIVVVDLVRDGAPLSTKAVLQQRE